MAAAQSLELGRKLGVFTLAKPLLAGLTYPYDWGIIPSTKVEDGDPLDVLIIHDAATYPRLVLTCTPIGVLEVIQSSKGKKERNDRVFVVPDRSSFEGDLQDIRRLPQRAIDELEKFFEANDKRARVEDLGIPGVTVVRPETLHRGPGRNIPVRATRLAIAAFEWDYGAGIALASVAETKGLKLPAVLE